MDDFWWLIAIALALVLLLLVVLAFAGAVWLSMRFVVAAVSMTLAALP